ncbi:ubiquitin-like-conjugating enzyme ATG10 isoform X2 [Genypterus blacodes]
MSSSLDEESFHHCCQLLLKLSDRLRDGWSWEAVQGCDEGYLKKTAVSSAEPRPPQDRQFGPDAADIMAGNTPDDDDEDDGVCEAPEGSSSSSQVLQYEYHILYSCSYRTPVLYFRAFTLEGRSLSLEEVWSSVHPNYRARLQQSPLNTITQQEHPMLGQPFFVLHPCRTEEFMSPVLQAAQQQSRWVNYVLTWLSVVAPVVGLEVPLDYWAHPSSSSP